MPGRGDQAGHRTGPGEVAESQRRIRQDLAEYHGQEGPPGRRQGARGGRGQVREVFLHQAWFRGLTTRHIPTVILTAARAFPRTLPERLPTLVILRTK